MDGPLLQFLNTEIRATLSPINVLSKYADDMNLIVLQYCDIDLATEFHNIQD